MTTTSLNQRQGRAVRKSRHQHQPLFDSLEAKFALSSGFVLGDYPETVAVDAGFSTASEQSPTVVQTSPEPGARLSQSPGEFSATFSRPIDPFSIFLDLRLFKKNQDSEWVPAGEYQDSLPTELTLDETGTRLIANFGALADGEYRLSLAGDSMITDLNGTMIDTQGLDQILSEFEIRGRGLTLEDATDLGTLGPEGLIVSGDMDFGVNPTDSKIFAVTLEQGHRWLFVGEINAQRNGSPVRLSLTLLDREGNVLETASTGRTDAPADPNVVRGLPPGRYYLLVTEKANAPGREGATNPVLGTGGVPTPESPAGPFELHLHVKPADEPTRVLGIRLEHADPSSHDVTGLSIQFAAPLHGQSLIMAGQDLLTLIDERGTQYPIHIQGYDQDNCVLKLAFDKELPEGRYRLLVPSGGITDLAGYRPSASGRNDGFLGFVDLDAPRSSPGLNDFGILYPSYALQGVGRKLSVAQAQMTEARFVVTAGGFFNIGLQYLGGRPTAVVVDSQGREYAVEFGDNGAASRNLLMLEPGPYLLRIIPEAGRGSLVTATVRQVQIMHDSVLNNGIGQGSAVGMTRIVPNPMNMTFIPTPLSPLAGSTFINPGLSNPGVVFPIGNAPSQSGSGTINPGVGESLTSVTPGSSLQPSTDSLAPYFTGNEVPIGQPSAINSGVAFVGPGSDDSSGALASNGPRGGAAVEASIGKARRLIIKKSKDGNKNNGANPTDGRLTEEELVGLTSAETIASDPDQLQRDGALVDKALSLPVIRNPFGPPSLDVLASQNSGDETTEDASEIEAGDFPRELNDGVRTDRTLADMSSSLGVGLVAVAAAHYQRKLGQWIGRVRHRLRPNLRQDDPSTSGSKPHLPRVR